MRGHLVVVFLIFIMLLGCSKKVTPTLTPTPSMEVLPSPTESPTLPPEIPIEVQVFSEPAQESALPPFLGYGYEKIPSVQCIKCHGSIHESQVVCSNDKTTAPRQVLDSVNFHPCNDVSQEAHQASD